MRVGERVAVCGPPRCATKWLVSVINEIEGKPMLVLGHGAHDVSRDLVTYKGVEVEYVPALRPTLVPIRQPDFWIESLYWDLKQTKNNRYPCTPELDGLYDKFPGTLREWAALWCKHPGLIMKIWRKYLHVADVVIPILEDSVKNAMVVNRLLLSIYSEATASPRKKAEGDKGHPMPVDLRYHVACTHADAFDVFNNHADIARDAVGIW